MKKIIQILIAIVTIAGGCKKYEKELKKIYGNYTLKTYTVDGVDSLSFYGDSLSRRFYLYYDDVNCYNVLKIDGSEESGTNDIVDCRWDLVNSFTCLSIYESYGAAGTGPFGMDRLSDWDIESNTTILKMKTVYNGKEYLIELE